jgi:hypothetical protein
VSAYGRVGVRAFLGELLVVRKAERTLRFNLRTEDRRPNGKSVNRQRPEFPSPFPPCPPCDVFLQLRPSWLTISLPAAISRIF